jgi:DNA-binding MarR family transcriptional regulator
MTKQALNYLLGQMEELGYLERVQDSLDQRFRRIRLTRRGRAAGAAMREIVSEVEAEWARKLGPRRFGELRDLLTRLSEGSGRVEEAPAPAGRGDASPLDD